MMPSIMLQAYETILQATDQDYGDYTKERIVKVVSNGCEYKGGTVDRQQIKSAAKIGHFMKRQQDLGLNCSHIYQRLSWNPSTAKSGQLPGPK